MVWSSRRNSAVGDLTPTPRFSGERQLLNVVEEMAIASGTPAPPVYLLDEEDGINAFAAGFTINDAVIGVTCGAVERLSRDELQGVIAHEFSHISQRGHVSQYPFDRFSARYPHHWHAGLFHVAGLGLFELPTPTV